MSDTLIDLHRNFNPLLYLMAAQGLPFLLNLSI
jgi:hypothetical protein